MHGPNRDDKPQTVGRCQLSAAQRFGQWQGGVRVDQVCVGVGDRVGPQVVLLDPRQSSACERWDLWPDQWLEANVSRLSQ